MSGLQSMGVGSGSGSGHSRDETWLATATHWSVVRRAVGYAVVVGLILILINHGDAIISGSWSPERTVRMALTLLVPYVVSTLSSVSAIRAGWAPPVLAHGDGSVGPARHQPNAGDPAQ